MRRKTGAGSPIAESWVYFQHIRCLITMTFTFTAPHGQLRFPNLESVLLQTQGGVRAQGQDPRECLNLWGTGLENPELSMTSENLRLKKEKGRGQSCPLTALLCCK